MLTQVKTDLNQIIIGSTAIKHWFPSFPREPKDLDLIVEHSKPHSNGVEYLLNPIIWNNRELYSKDGYLLPDVLATLKASHLAWDLKWSSHMWDLQFLLNKGCKIDSKLFYELYDYWNVYHSKNKRSDLKISKEDFFNNAINYDEAEHDYLHTLINPVPIYTKVLKDGCEVELDETKFHNLTYEDKLDFLVEEISIMSAERYQGLNYRVRYEKMCKKFLLSHCPLFALIFALENFIKIHKAPYNFMEKINNKLKEAGKPVLQ